MDKTVKAFLACVAMYVLIYVVVSITEMVMWQILGY